MKTKLSCILKKSSYWLGVIALGTILGMSLQFAKAWTEPTAPAPSGNIGAPINTSATGQTKSGHLSSAGVITGGSLASLGSVTGNSFCLGTLPCITSWPSGGTSQWVTSGSNIYYNAGNVGIGTTSPGDYKLSVIGGRTNFGETTHWNGNVGAGLISWNTNGFVIRSSAGTKLTLGSNNSENKLVIDTDGDVGIGKTDPSYKLDVNGKINGNLNLTQKTAAITSTGMGTNNFPIYCDSGKTPVSCGTDKVLGAGGNEDIIGCRLDLANNACLYWTDLVGSGNDGITGYCYCM
jgi:hypothetical protein